MSHTPGKLRVYFSDSLRAWPGIDNGASKIVVHADVRGHRRSGVGGDTEEEVQANARRLVACWNACDGISTEILEQSVVKPTLSDHTDAIAAQRDVLLRELISARNIIFELQSVMSGKFFEAQIAAFDAAIAKAEGKQ